MPKSIPFSEELVDEILSYLGDQKYVQVAPIINKIGRAVEESREKPTLVPAAKSKEE